MLLYHQSGICYL